MEEMSYRRLAGEVELGNAVRSHCTPNSLDLSLSIGTDRVWLPWLIKGLKVEDIGAPVQSSADTRVPKGLGVGGRGNGSTVVGATVGRPASLTSPELNGANGAGHVLYVGKRLRHVVEVSGGGV